MSTLSATDIPDVGHGKSLTPVWSAGPEELLKSVNFEVSSTFLHLQKVDVSFSCFPSPLDLSCLSRTPSLPLALNVSVPPSQVIPRCLETPLNCSWTAWLRRATGAPEWSPMRSCRWLTSPSRLTTAPRWQRCRWSRATSSRTRPLATRPPA